VKISGEEVAFLGALGALGGLAVNGFAGNWQLTAGN
jgi:hypothetical protein